MASSIQRRRGTTSDHSTFTGAVGEITIDTTKDTVVVHDGTTAGGLPLLRQDGSNSALALGSEGAPSLKWDANTGIFSPGADQLAISTNGVERVKFGTAEVVFNDTGVNYDFRIEGDTVDSLFFVDASTDCVGIGTSSPSSILHLNTTTGINNLQAFSLANTTKAYIGLSAVTSSPLIGAAVNDLCFRSENANIRFGTASSTRTDVTITSAGLVGIGTTGPAVPFVVQTTSNTEIRLSTSANTTGQTNTIRFSSTAASSAYAGAGAYIQSIQGSGLDAHDLAFGTTFGSTAERVRIDSSGRLLVGTPTARTNFNTGAEQSHIQLEGTTFNTANLSIVRNSVNDGTAALTLGKSRSATVNGNTVVVSGDPLGFINFEGADGTNMVRGASITAQVDSTATITAGSFVNNRRYKIATVGTTNFMLIGASANTEGVIFIATGVGAGTGTATSEPYANSMPGRLVFSTTADGAAAPTERMRIANNGVVTFTKSGANSVSIGGVTSESIFRNQSGMAGIHFSTASVLPTDGSGAVGDNSISLGVGSHRWSVVYAGTGTINTSDANLKQDINKLEQAELNVASAIKRRIKKFRFVDAVTDKGNDARIHVGVIAQEVEQAFVDEGLNPRRYALFCEDTLEDGSKRLGIRYDELLAFVIAAQ